MKDETSIFGAKSDKLDRLLRLAMKSPEEENQDAQKASLETLLEKPGGRIDKYKLLQVLGEGGMGIVYLAQQEEPVRREVALKVIKPGMDSKRVIARFEAEKQVLALMQHPNIAGVYDAGLTLTGRPYFVMEYIKGTPITDYCDQHKLTIKERLGLFVQVCQAVHHAHQKGIIHRDIKPSNILVSMENNRAIPKVIDFGVAKATGKSLTEHTIATEDSQLLGTPEYMSPEQADMATEDIDIRSDVYSLGVLLYVLLTGVTPFDSNTLRTGGIEHVRQVIRETDPKTPSTRLTSLGDEAGKIAKMRQTEISTLAKNLKKELEWIPLKAMRKERTERYQSASELADDIENYLTNKPLIAGPPATIYFIKKFIRRHKPLVAGTITVISVFTIGIIVSSFFAFKANRQAETSKAFADFLVKDILGAESFSEGQELDPDYFLNNATQKLEDKFHNQPLEEAKIRVALGQRYLSIGRPEKAIRLIDRAYQIRLQHLGPDHQSTIYTTNTICWAYCNLDRHHDAIKLWNEQIEIIRREYGELHGLGMMFMMNIGQTYVHLGKYKEAEEWLDKTMELCDRSDSSRMPYVRRMARLHQGNNYLAQERYDEAKQILTKTLEEQQGAKDWRTLKFTIILSNVYRLQGQYEKAQHLCKKTLDVMRQELGETHSETLVAKHCLGQIFLDQGFFDEAEKLFKEALGDQKRKFGDDHVNTLISSNSLAVLYIKQARYEEAEPLLIETVENRSLKLGDTHPHTMESLNNLIGLYEAWNKPEKAEEWRAKLQKTETAEE